MADTKVALVTGSSSGIGAATVRLLSSKGYKVVVVGSKKEKLDAVAKECAELSPQKLQPLVLALDFSDPNNGELAVKRTLEHFGRLDVLVNNAGIFVRSLGTEPASYEAYRQVMTVNTDATVKATLAAVDHLKRTKGNLVFVSSVASMKASERGYAYCMSKAAMSMFAKCLAIDLAPDVRVNIVSPGPCSTPIFERVGIQEQQVAGLMDHTVLQGRVGRSDEIASTIAFLVSDEASFVNGHEMVVDGGYLLTPAERGFSRTIISAQQKALISKTQ